MKAVAHFIPRLLSINIVTGKRYELSSLFKKPSLSLGKAAWLKGVTSLNDYLLL